MKPYYNIVDLKKIVIDWKNNLCKNLKKKRLLKVVVDTQWVCSVSNLHYIRGVDVGVLLSGSATEDTWKI